MMPLRLFRSRQFDAANAVTVLVYGALGGAFFLLPVELQQGAGYSAVAAGASLLPVTAMLLLLSARMGKFASKHGPRLQMTIGPIIAGAGIALLALISTRCELLRRRAARRPGLWCWHCDHGRAADGDGDGGRATG